MVPLYAMVPLIMLYKVYVSFISGSSQDVDVSSWLILMASFDGESISFSTKSTILVIAFLRVWLPLFESAKRSVTLRTSSFLSASTPIILDNGHWLCWQSCSCNITMLPTSKFLFLSFHFCLVCKLCRNSFLHLCQKLLYNMLHTSPFFLEYRSGFVKITGGGMIKFIFIANRLLGESGIWLLISLMVSSVSGLQLIIDPTSVTKVLCASSFNDCPCVFSNSSNLSLFEFGFPHTSHVWCFGWVLAGS